MNFKAVRKERGWTQQNAARQLGVSQTLVSFWERGTRSPSRRCLDKLCYLGVKLDPVTLPMRADSDSAAVDFAQELANLGYPGFAHYQNGAPKWNPAQLLVLALAENALDRRVAEALPWLVLRYSEMNWEWVRREAKLRDLQNRLGFTLLLGQELAVRKEGSEVAHQLATLEQDLRRSLLAKEDTYCNDRITRSERNWLRQHRSQEAAVWNLLSDLRPEHLAHDTDVLARDDSRRAGSQ
jgi:transcriptional regulator with XRE-family HTH domain